MEDSSPIIWFYNYLIELRMISWTSNKNPCPYRTELPLVHVLRRTFFVIFIYMAKSLLIFPCFNFFMCRYSARFLCLYQLKWNQVRDDIHSTLENTLIPPGIPYH